LHVAAFYPRTALRAPPNRLDNVTTGLWTASSAPPAAHLQQCRSGCEYLRISRSTRARTTTGYTLRCTHTLHLPLRHCHVLHCAPLRLGTLALPAPFDFAMHAHPTPHAVAFSAMLFCFYRISLYLRSPRTCDAHIPLPTTHAHRTADGGACLPLPRTPPLLRTTRFYYCRPQHGPALRCLPEHKTRARLPTLPPFGVKTRFTLDTEVNWDIVLPPHRTIRRDLCVAPPSTPRPGPHCAASSTPATPPLGGRAHCLRWRTRLPRRFHH